MTIDERIAIAVEVLDAEARTEPRTILEQAYLLLGEDVSDESIATLAVFASDTLETTVEMALGKMGAESTIATAAFCVFLAGMGFEKRLSVEGLLQDILQ